MPRWAACGPKGPRSTRPARRCPPPLRHHRRPARPGSGRRHHRGGRAPAGGWAAGGGAARPLAIGCSRCGTPPTGRRGIRPRPPPARPVPPAVVEVRQQFHHGPATGHGAGHGLGPCVQAGQPGQVATDEPPYLPVAPDLARAGIVDHHLTRPLLLQQVSVTLVQRGEVLRDRIGLTRGAALPARQLHGADEIRKPRHRNTTLPRPPGTPRRRRPLPAPVPSVMASHPASRVVSHRSAIILGGYDPRGTHH